VDFSRVEEILQGASLVGSPVVTVNSTVGLTVGSPTVASTAVQLPVTASNGTAPDTLFVVSVRVTASGPQGVFTLVGYLQVLTQGIKG
jgi:hypothetical protein